MKLVLLDNGHGGIINNEYQTAGKRSPVWKDGSILYEGEFNRYIVQGIMYKLNILGIPYVNLVPEQEDISLSERCARANSYGTDSVLISDHSNAGGGKGFSAYTYYGQSKSDEYATILYTEFAKEFPTLNVRTDFVEGDIDKEAGFYILKHTTMPAILTENLFMDNEHECIEYLLRPEGRARIIDFHVTAIKQIVEY